MPNDPTRMSAPFTPPPTQSYNRVPQNQNQRQQAPPPPNVKAPPSPALTEKLAPSRIGTLSQRLSLIACLPGPPSLHFHRLTCGHIVKAANLYANCANNCIGPWAPELRHNFLSSLGGDVQGVDRYGSPEATPTRPSLPRNNRGQFRRGSRGGCGAGTPRKLATNVSEGASPAGSKIRGEFACEVCISELVEQCRVAGASDDDIRSLKDSERLGKKRTELSHLMNWAAVLEDREFENLVTMVRQSVNDTVAELKDAEMKEECDEDDIMDDYEEIEMRVMTSNRRPA